MDNIKQYLPLIYDGVTEMEALVSSEQKLLDKIIVEYTKWHLNQYILTADEEGIKIFEDQVNILASPDETLEYRRQRLISRVSMQPPFTMRYLRGKLDEYIGKDSWNAWVDYPNFTLYIESAAENQMWYQEIAIFINRIKPANIVFVNRPLVGHKINLSESVNIRELTWNYHLGTTWFLGQKPFISYTDEEALVLSRTPSITNNMLNQTATFAAGKIAKVRLNGSTVLTTFEVKSASNNVVTIEYNVFPTDSLTVVTKIELLDSSNNVLTSSGVYIPLVEGIKLKHTLLVTEGSE